MNTLVLSLIISWGCFYAIDSYFPQTDQNKALLWRTPIVCIQEVFNWILLCICMSSSAAIVEAFDLQSQ